jgi:hypothetical protein
MPLLSGRTLTPLSAVRAAWRLPPLKDRVDVTEGLVATVASALSAATDRHLGHDRAVFPLEGAAKDAYRAAIIDAIVLFMLSKNARV